MTSAHSEPELRAALDAVPRYKAGVAPPPGPVGLTAYKVASNENPYPPLPGVLAAIADAATGVNRYPDFAATELTQALSKSLNVAADQLALGTGSVALIQYAVQISCDQGDALVYAWPSFEAYPIVAAIAGAESIQVRVNDSYEHDLAGMAAAITDKTSMVIVCSPNNPTGTSFSRAQLVEFLQSVPSRVLVVLDEAYVEFVDDDRDLRSVDLVKQFPNLCVMRTFSKAYGLAGLRLGYAIASPTVAGALRAVSLPFGISAVAQAAGLAILAPAAQGELQLRVDHLKAERSRVLTALGPMATQDAQGNFVWLPLGERSETFASMCSQQALSVRLFSGVGVRVTIAERAANDRLIALASEFVSP